MTVFALLPGVCSLQDIACQGMVEFFRIEADDFKISSVVVAMALHTFFAFYLLRHVVTLILQDSVLQEAVTIQAFLIGHLIAQVVAFCAIRQALQVSVNRR